MTKKFANKVTIIGPGLIGSSLGLALKKIKIGDKIVGVDPSKKNLNDALINGSIDEGTTNLDDKILNSKIIFICTPVSSIENLTKKILQFTNPETIITDVGSVKQIFQKSTLSLVKKHCKIVPGHPIAGTEHSGAINADKAIFKNKWCILTPVDSNKKEVKIISKIWEDIGMKISLMSAFEHDKIMSITSHLPHLIAFTIVGTAFNKNLKKKKELFNFSAGGFKDFTRIGSSDPKMWTDIFLQNKNHILKTLDDFLSDLQTLKKNISNNNSTQIMNLLKKTKKIRKGILDVEKNFGRSK